MDIPQDTAERLKKALTLVSIAISVIIQVINHYTRKDV